MWFTSLHDLITNLVISLIAVVTVLDHVSQSCNKLHEPQFRRPLVPCCGTGDFGTSNLPLEWNNRSKPSPLFHTLSPRLCQLTFRKFTEQLRRPNEGVKLSSEFYYPLYPLGWASLCYRHKLRSFSTNAAIAFPRLKVHHVDRRVSHSLNRLSLLTPWSGSCNFNPRRQMSRSTLDGKGYSRRKDATQLWTERPPCYFNNQLPTSIACLPRLCLTQEMYLTNTIPSIAVLV